MVCVMVGICNLLAVSRGGGGGGGINRYVGEREKGFLPWKREKGGFLVCFRTFGGLLPFVVVCGA